MKLINYICDVCNLEVEDLVDNPEETEEIIQCPYCDTPMTQFNIKNNGQVWKYNDK